jgi:hypothetical protein
MFTAQPYIANSILNYEMEIDYLCPRQRWMNGWVRTESINVYLASVVAQSFYEVPGDEKTNKKDMWKEEFMKKREERSKRRVEISERSWRGKASICPKSYRKDQVLWICFKMETLYNMYAFERVKDFQQF